ncbi:MULTISPECIES: hypothetical protein [unclassified Crossiella]|uniref:hypothetical protein n=1 Tax=unclassified Crossiella TaxID=2620835 RepID=UPI0020002512|nr:MULTISPECIES: hypothetical protein [unclassified Crossiella]MCK2239083.1 hypothetical protein [Crossiella sp. S99.2]MCK2251348.1 hypothetical protein [Crossiella sp. S99.1]
MPETTVVTTRRLLAHALVQVLTAGVVGAVGVIFGLSVVVASVLVLGPAGALVGLVVIPAGIALLYLMATLTPAASALTDTRAGRICWSVLVGGVGGLGWWLSVTVSEGVLSAGRTGLLLGGVPFALVAGMLLRRWYLSLGFLALTLAIAYGFLHILAAASPELSEPDRRLAAARHTRAELAITDLPGYHRTLGDRGWQLTPVDPAANRPEHRVSIIGSTSWDPGSCATQTRPGGPLRECVVEQPGLEYRRGEDWHEYRRDGVRAAVRGGLGVDRGVLREAASRARVVTDAEILALFPPAPPEPETVVEAVRKFARWIAG